MKTNLVDATKVISDALASSRFQVGGSKDRLIEYFVTGLRSGSGFIVEGSPEKFANYLLLSAANVSGRLTEGAASGVSGFTIKGDYEFAWARQYFDAAASGNSGFTVVSK